MQYNPITVVNIIIEEQLQYSNFKVFDYCFRQTQSIFLT